MSSLDANNSVQEQNIYEFPLNERIRYFLRYESLIQGADKSLAREDDIATLRSLNRLISFIGNHDLRRELLHQLGLQNELLDKFSAADDVDTHKLSQCFARNKAALEHLHEFSISLPDYRNHQFLANTMRQLTLQSGICSFDLPELMAWKQIPWRERAMVLDRWLAPMREFGEKMAVSLDLTRQSGEFRPLCAKQGYFSENPAMGHDLQMVRIRIDSVTPCYPVISAGIQLLTAHFMDPGDFSAPPIQEKRDTKFEMAYCIM